MRNATKLFLFSAIGLHAPNHAQAKTGLQGTAGHQSVFFSEQLRTRHHRYFIDLKQNTELLPYRLSTVVEGRFITDQAVSKSKYAPNWEFTKSVRDDEFIETIARQVYIDYITDSTATKVGLQQIDWIESMAQNVANVLTPIDLRFGGFGASNELIRPVGAFKFNHKFFLGSMDWLLVTHPAHHRLPKDDNAYGYYNTLGSLVGGAEFTVETKSSEPSLKNAETGLRYLMNFTSFNLTAIAYRGDSRSPILRARAISPQQFTITENHPKLNTYVVSGSTSSDEALVVRALFLHQPNRPVAYSLGLPTTQNIPPEATQKHSRLVGGLDYAFSKHFKFYSESVLSKTLTTPSRFYKDSGRPEPNESEHAISIRITNESFDDTVLSLDTTFTGPDKSSAITGQAEWAIGGLYRLNVGARRINASNSDSAFYPLRKTSQYFLTLERSFNEKSFL